MTNLEDLIGMGELSVDGIVGCNTWKKITSIVNGMGKSKYTKYY